MDNVSECLLQRRRYGCDPTKEMVTAGGWLLEGAAELVVGSEASPQKGRKGPGSAGAREENGRIDFLSQGLAEHVSTDQRRRRSVVGVPRNEEPISCCCSS